MVCATCKEKKRKKFQLSSVKTIFVFLSRLEWKYVKIIEVQEVNMEV